MNDIIHITEYERLSLKEDEPRGKGELDPKRFGLLREFIISNKESKTQPAELMGISPKKGGGEQIYAKNYVGVISLADGTQIEILPKIYGRIHGDDMADGVPGKEELDESKRIFLRMLRTVSDLRSRSLQSAEMETARMPLFEVFVRMFLDEVFEIVKRGLKGGYTLVSRNEPFMKGKILVAQNIRENFAHAERFYVQYDEFNYDQPENRLIRTTLEYLKKRSRDARNMQDINTLLCETEGINQSVDIEGDMKKATVSERSNAYYQTALSWCGVFLRGETFTSFAGKAYATAILFPMDALYERYVAKMLKRYLPKGYSVCPQMRGLHLFKSQSMFSIRPDVVISKGGKTVILDTKWKILNSNPSVKYGISQGDMYQMYAYFREYNADGRHVQSVMTLYPETDDVPGITNYEFSCPGDGYGDTCPAVKIRFLDLTEEGEVSESVGEERRFRNLIDEIERDLV